MDEHLLGYFKYKNEGGGCTKTEGGYHIGDFLNLYFEVNTELNCTTLDEQGEIKIITYT